MSDDDWASVLSLETHNMGIYKLDTERISRFSSQSDQDPDIIRQKNEVNESLLDESVNKEKEEILPIKKLNVKEENKTIEL